MAKQADKIYILNGPNLNMLGLRETDIYGSKSLKDIEQACRQHLEKTAKGLYTLRFVQSNHEGALIDEIHKAYLDGAALLINPAAYGHTSLALYDALKMLREQPIIEIHLSLPQAREAFRHKTYVSKLAKGVISGLGYKSYILALDAALWLLQTPES